MSAPEAPQRAAVEHVRACCPTLIATLVAMARASQERKDVQPTREPADVTP
jgi:hypothetical protein